MCLRVRHEGQGVFFYRHVRSETVVPQHLVFLGASKRVYLFRGIQVASVLPVFIMAPRVKDRGREAGEEYGVGTGR